MQISDRDAFIDATLTLLRERDFAPRRVNRDQGMIVSNPSTSKQWFEFWRNDAIGGYQFLESSIHTIRRIVTIRIEPVDDDAESENYRVAVEVEKERFSAPERQVTTASGALAIYSERLPTSEGIMAARTSGAHWVPLGRDALFEDYLLSKVAAQAP